MNSIATFSQWLANRDWAMDFSASAEVYPIVLATHLTCIAVFGGMILLTNLRLLGWTLKSFSISDVVGGFRIWKRIGFCIMVTCGFLLAGSEANKYYDNPFFWLKMTLLVLIGVHGLVFRPSVYLNTAQLDRTPVIPPRAKLAARLSLVLWIGVVSMGRMIGYYDGPSELGIPLGEVKQSLYHHIDPVQPKLGSTISTATLPFNRNSSMMFRSAVLYLFETNLMYLGIPALLLQPRLFCDRMAPPGAVSAFA